MNQSATGGIIVVAGLAITFGGWTMLPVLESGETANARTAGQRVERARRLLHRHSPTMRHAEMRRTSLASLSGDLERAGLEGMDADALAGVDGDLFHEKFDAISERNESGFRASGGDPSGEIRSAAQAWASVTQENAGLLDRALAEVNLAISVSPENAEAYRLKAVVHYHDGLSRAGQALAIRAGAQPLRDEIARLVRESLDLKEQSQSSIEASIAAQIASLDQRQRELQGETDQVSARFAALERTLADLEAKKSQADAAAASTRNKLDTLRERGVDLSDPQGGAAYSDQYLALARDYDASFRAAHIAEYGDYPQAEIDRSGDYIKGRYVENGSDKNLTVRHGLIHFRDERAVVSARLDGLRTTIADLRTDKARLEAETTAHSDRIARASKRLGEIASEASTLWAELSDLGGEASQIEEAASGVLSSSASSASQAASRSAAWVRNARDLQDAVSDSAKDRSPFKPRLDDRWIEGYAKALEADAHLAAAWIQYSRFDHGRRDADLLDAAGSALNLGGGAAEKRAQSGAARKEGTASVVSAMNALKAAHEGVGQHWTIVAQGAGVEYLLALFGDEDRVAGVIESYRSALQGRENEDFSAVLAARLDVLENR